MRRVCVQLGSITIWACQTVFYSVCDAFGTLTQTICDAVETITQTICDATETITQTICDATTTVSQTVCDATKWIPLLGDLICIVSHVVTTVVCTLSHVVSEVVCVASHVVSTTICIASHVVTSVVCIAWRLVTGLICVVVGTIARVICLFIRCGLAYFTATNEVSERRAECIYGWSARYRIEERPECQLMVTLRIRLVAATGVTAADIAARQAVWEPAIEAAWSNRFPLVRSAGDCECERYNVTVNVVWVTNGEHHTVTVRPGSGRADMTHWFVTSTGGTAAHEAGHMFGNVDEYADKNCPSRTVTGDGSIMQNSQTGTVRSRHYQGFADWLSRRTCCTYVVGS